jgi:ubiquinone/menaquinone biosynthesis C-methylase UbiE
MLICAVYLEKQTHILNFKMMNNQEAYNQWASSYNDVVNLTRDVELTGKKRNTEKCPISTALELGCGTGKEYRMVIAKSNTSITSVDFF